MTKKVEPSIKETAFSCPHCGAYTTQYWYKLYSEAYSRNEPIPFIPSEKEKEELAKGSEPPEKKKAIMEWLEKRLTKLINFEDDYETHYCKQQAINLHLSQCYNCKKIAVWVHERLIFPTQKIGISPNSDIPPEIIQDFEEAREISDASPRGAAALLRLCIQKLCIHLGEKGTDLNNDIGSLVKKGLNPIVQQSLDIVRVIGNEAVHPGIIDLKDDYDTVISLFQILHSIVDQMISHPKNIKEMYEKLPESKRQAIEKRDGKK